MTKNKSKKQKANIKKSISKKNNKNIAKIKILAIIIICFAIIISIIVLINKESQEYYFDEENDDKFKLLRENMIENQLKARDITDEKVLNAMKKVERHKFVPESIKNNAYQDNPLPIGHGQTISQPYIVALMTQLAEVKQNYKALEIGAGSGYQAAILAELINEVYTIEIIEELAESSKKVLKELEYTNVKVKHADGYYGWKEHAPFNIIMITAASNHVPPPLLEQLADGGKLIIPLGDIRRFQTLTIVTRKGDEYSTEFISNVRFVPMTGRAMEAEI
ncbi:MAG: protein-L-isoaspartate(D-aspartate) O-methyltransferase [Candidatus Woesearchaeota archaeon]